MRTEYPRRFDGVWIPREVYQREGLTPLAKILWAEIRSLDTTGEGCPAPDAYLARVGGVSTPEVREALSGLRAAGLLDVRGARDARRLFAYGEAEPQFTTSQPAHLPASPEGPPDPPCFPPLGNPPLYPPDPPPYIGAEKDLSKPAPDTVPNLTRPPPPTKAPRHTISPAIQAYAEQFLDAQRKEWPNYLRKITPAMVALAADVIDKLERIDGHDFETVIRPALEWARRDDFWSRNVISPSGLRNVSERNGMTKFVNILTSRDLHLRRAAPTPQPGGAAEAPRTAVEGVCFRRWGEVAGRPAAGSDLRELRALGEALGVFCSGLPGNPLQQDITPAFLPNGRPNHDHRRSARHLFPRPEHLAEAYWDWAARTFRGREVGSPALFRFGGACWIKFVSETERRAGFELKTGRVREANC